MELVLFVVFSLIVISLVGTTAVAVVLAYRDIEGKTVAVTTAVFGVLVLGFVSLVFYEITLNAPVARIMVWGIVVFFAMFALWLLHIMCAMVSESEHFGQTVLVVDFFCTIGLIIMLGIGLLG